MLIIRKHKAHSDIGDNGIRKAMRDTFCGGLSSGLKANAAASRSAARAREHVLHPRRPVPDTVGRRAAFLTQTVPALGPAAELSRVVRELYGRASTAIHGPGVRVGANAASAPSQLGCDGRLARPGRPFDLQVQV